VRYLNVALSGLLAIAFVSPAAADGDVPSPPPPAAPEPPPWEMKHLFMGGWSELVELAKLPAVKQDRLKAVLDECDQALAAWDRAKLDRMMQAQQALTEADNKDQKAQIQRAIQAMQAQRRAIVARAEAQGLALLPPRARGEYFGPRLQEFVLAKLPSVMLSEKQAQAVTSLCAAAGQQVRRMQLDPGSDKAKDENDGDPALRAMLKRIHGTIVARILTPEQRKSLKPPKKNKKK